MDEIALLKRRFERERKARKQAEKHTGRKGA